LPRDKWRAGAVVVVGISVEPAAQMRLAKDDHVIQALSSDRSDRSLDVPVLPRRPGCRRSVSDTHGSEASPEDLSVDAIVVANELSGRRIPRKGLQNLAGDRIRRRASGDSDVNQPTPVMAQDDEAEQQFKGRRGNHEEVDRGNAIGVVSKEGHPRLRGRTPALGYVLGHGRLRHVDADLEELTVDTWSAPQGIGQAHLADQGPHFWRDSRPAQAIPGLPAPERLKASPMSAHNGLRLDDHDRLQNARPQSIEQGKQQPIRASKP